MTTKITKYTKNSGGTSINGLTIKCCDGLVLVSGSVDITKDRVGLADAVELKSQVDHINDEIKRKTAYCPWGVRTVTTPLAPFANETDTCNIGNLVIENRIDRVSIYGRLEIGGNLAGQASVTAFKRLVDGIVAVLQADKNLPKMVTIEEAKEVPNPFDTSCQ